jgi:hypothetical protein
LGLYHGTKIRHFHRLWEKWVYGKTAPTSR